MLDARQDLRKNSALGEYGAIAIHDYLTAEGTACPSVRTIGRILSRNGALDGKRRVRRTPPGAGWYLPQVAAASVELDSFDTIEGLVLRGGPDVTVATGISLHGGSPVAWPVTRLTTTVFLEFLLGHWRQSGLPAYAQFDNDTRFQGPHRHAGVLGRVIRLCLSLGVTPVFAPPKETGFQAAIESLNGRWQAKVWARFEHRSLKQLQQRSMSYIQAARQKLAVRIDSAPPRRPFPKDHQLDLRTAPEGTLVYLRRTNDNGRATVLGQSFAVDRHWSHRLVRAEVNLTASVVRFYALRRRTPDEQPLLAQRPYRPRRQPARE